MFRLALRFSLAVLFAASMPALALAVPHAGDPAPPFTLPRTAGGTLSLASLKGKPVYLNFFASWCAPCNEEAPAVVRLYKEYHPKGLVTLGIDYEEERDKAVGFGKKYGAPYPLLLDDGKMGSDYGVLALPVHVFIDRNGKISTYRLGEMDPGEIEAAIKKIL